MYKKADLKVSKGYRLKPSTHNLVKKIQIVSNSTQDKVISRALRVYYSELRRNNNLKT